jgi:hypothetical protein
MASYGGLNIFGSAVSMSTAPLARAQQINSFFGLSGVEILDGGSRGMVTVAAGFLYGNSLAALASVENQFRSMSNGVARPLVDMVGIIWGNVLLQTYRPQGRILCAANGYYLRAYQARFFHLS